MFHLSFMYFRTENVSRISETKARQDSPSTSPSASPSLPPITSPSIIIRSEIQESGIMGDKDGAVFFPELLMKVVLQNR